MVDITVLGDTNLDILLSVKQIPESEQVFVESMKLKVGGGAANFAQASAALGLKTRLISSVGSDVIGDFILKELKGIDLHVKKLGCPTGVSVALQFPDGSKKLFSFRSHNRFFSLKDFSLSAIEGDWLQVFGYNLMDNLRGDMPTVLKYAKERKMVVGIDPDLKAGLNFDLKEFYQLLRYVDVLFLNEKELSLLDARKLKVKTLVVKRGSRGAKAVEGEEAAEIEGVKVEPKMPTGVGDVFDAAFVHHYFYGYDLEECLEFAQKKAVEYLTKTS